MTAPALRRGRQPKERPVHEVGELTRADLEKLKTRRDTPVVQRFRDPHHRLARCLAMGMRVTEAAEECGFSEARVYMFNADPAFSNLVEHYRGVVTQEFKEATQGYMGLLVSNQMKAERMIAEKLDKADEEGELPPTRDLLAIARDAADRTGAGKKSTNVNLNIDFAAQLEGAIKRSGKVIDITPPKPVARHSPSSNQPYVATGTDARLPAPSTPPGVVTLAPMAHPLPALSEPALLKRRA